MQKKSCFYLLVYLLSGIYLSNQAATLFVTNLLDDGSPGSLRGTIAAASSGDTIQFSVAGTIFLDPLLGVLVVNKTLIIDAQNQIILDGQDQLNIGIRIATSNANNTQIKNITIQNFSGNQYAMGVLLDQFASGCSVINTRIINISSGSGNALQSYAGGILSDISPGTWEPFHNILGNTITNIRSSDKLGGNTGFAVGIGADAITGACSDNVITNIISGDALNYSAFTNFTAGISVGLLNNCTNNQVSNVQSGAANYSSMVVGILGGAITGECSGNTIMDLLSGHANIQSGDVVGIISASSMNANCNSNTITGLYSGDSNNTGRVLGITTSLWGSVSLNGDCCGNMLSALASGAAQNNSGLVSGIDAHSVSGDCNNNIIETLTSGVANNNAGSVRGIFEKTTLSGTLIGNVVTNLSAGVHTNNTPEVIGIYVKEILGNCSHNCVSTISSGGGSVSGYIGGMKLLEFGGHRIVECNHIENVAGGNGSFTFGMHIEEGFDLKVHHNMISLIADAQQEAHGLILGSNSNGGNIVENSLVCGNKICSVIGNNANGYGITLLGNLSPSVGNDLFGNSIFDINGKAINILSNGVPTDGTVHLTSVGCGINEIVATGTLFPAAGFEHSEFLLQFFVSDNNLPAQAKTLLGETSIVANGETLFIEQLPICASIGDNQFVTATATMLPNSSGENNNTSELSNAVIGCNNLAFCPGT